MAEMSFFVEPETAKPRKKSVSNRVGLVVSVVIILATFQVSRVYVLFMSRAGQVTT